MASRHLVKLRILGLPPQMAGTAVPAVLRDDRAVSALELVEIESGITLVTAIDVTVAEGEAVRVREKILNSFAAVYVEDLLDGDASRPKRRAKLLSRSPKADSNEGEA